MKYFRVKYGYGKDDFYSIDETELPRALKAQGSGGVVAFKQGTVAGNNIMAIKPDYNRYLGLNPEYEMVGRDYADIPPSVIEGYQQALSGSMVSLGAGGASKKIEVRGEVKALAEHMTVKPV